MNEHIALTVLAPRCDRYAMRLTVGEHSARHVRRIVRSLLREWKMEEVSDAVELGVTELLANVVRHVPGRRCALLVLRRPQGVRVEVADGSDQVPCSPANLAPDAEHGRGLVLLAAVSDAWGVVPGERGGKTVWFECARGTHT
ncbi:ATP-binding protein [Streptomyces sp. RO-S4]|uniref:ATP-binding protein n=1 Tax=Streptomyces sp. RO-S4 TaxID=2902486 RepID=UPI0035B38370|nr:ATP-binding protein [Streptomyces sp. RO-S4]